MFIGYLRVELFIPHSRSLKDKRQVVLSIKQRLRQRFNISIAEEPSDKWQRCRLACVYVNYHRGEVGNTLAKVEENVRNHIHFQVIDSEYEVF
ncbi:MAG: DUF503 domain-containing protein [Candidatus Omnitrophica bacterium]|nr:DUF503 domain-containing protein [Candidatus Omnitrophota bacterium]